MSNIKLYCCDNLELMKTLQDNYIDLIYCDILYGTGRNFDDYQDLKCDRKIIEEHYIPRLKEMYRVLKNTGSIYLQMDTRINHWMRCLMDDVFGYDNFRNEIIWSYNWGGRSKTKFAQKHDTIFFYSKTNNYNFYTDKIRIPYKTIVSEKTKNPLVNRDKLNKGQIPTSVWTDITIIHTNSKEAKENKYNTKKPEKLLERIIKASSNENDLVADFYLGSGTTAIVCKNLNRNFIGCDISEKAIEISKNRVE